MKSSSALVLLACFLLLPYSAGAQRTAGEAARQVPVSQWHDPFGGQPMSFDQWRELVGPPRPFDSELAYNSPRVMAAGQPLVVVAVDSHIASQIAPKIDRYILDLEADGYAVSYQTVSGGSPADLKSILLSYAGDGLVGVVLVGAMPVAWFEMNDDFNGYTEFPTDLYYMDLDGQWMDADSDGRFDSHTDGSGDTAPDIWLSRLTTPTGSGSDAALIAAYFDKNHTYRTGGIWRLPLALQYVDDDWIPFAGQWSEDLSLSKTQVTCISSGEVTVADDYESRLPQEYEWVQVNVHSSTYGHSFKIGTSWTGGYTTYTDVRDIDLGANFYNLYACSSGRYTSPGYIAGHYLFGLSDALEVVATTKTGGMLDFDLFYAPIGDGETFGEAFRSWWCDHWPFDAEDRRWFYGMVLLGDGSLRRLHPPRILHTPLEYRDADGRPYTITAAVEHCAPLDGPPQLYWSTSPVGPFQAVEMTCVGGDTYAAQIPPQEPYTVICYYIRAQDNGGRVGCSPLLAPDEYHHFQVVHTIMAAEMMPDGSFVQLADKIVTAVFDGFFYVESRDRCAAIRVESAYPVAKGDSVDLMGWAITTADYERCISVVWLEVNGQGSIAPLFTSCAGVVGADLSYDPLTGAGQRGLAEAVGPNTVGLLLKICGRVVSVGSGWFDVRDGNGAVVRVECAGASLPAEGDCIAATGIASMYNDGTLKRRLLVDDSALITAVE